MNRSENTKGHFFDERQKQAKGDMMRSLIDCFFEELVKNKEIFNDMQSLSDLFGSILVMFNREIICHWIITMDLTHARKDMMKSMFDTIKEEVNKTIRNRAN